jgi:hypothetical protein
MVSARSARTIARAGLCVGPVLGRSFRRSAAGAATMVFAPHVSTVMMLGQDDRHEP